MTIFSSIIRVYSLYIRINGNSLYGSVLACSLDCMAAQTRPNLKKGGDSYIDLKSKINIELILLTFKFTIQEDVAWYVRAFAARWKYQNQNIVGVPGFDVFLSFAEKDYLPMLFFVRVH